jgi:hypothetical protein
MALAVRWYARFRLSYADVAEWLAERGFAVDRSAIYRWVQRFLPLFGVAAPASPTGGQEVAGGRDLLRLPRPARLNL